MKSKLLLVFFVFGFLCMTPSCSKKSGCPSMTKPSKKQKKKGTSNLFSKKMRKRSKRR